ncbi:MAG: hypothetical protein Q7U57_01490 [Methylovulum sp.]|nr:hypothetical protein [Methylovulum sp.]
MQRNRFFATHTRQLVLAAAFCCASNTWADNTWNYRQEHDRLNNQTYSIALSPLPRRDLYDELKLEIVCKDNTLLVAIAADSLIASQGSKFDLEYQIDKQAPVTLQMQTFPDSKRKGYTKDEAKPMVDAILTGRDAVFIRVKTMIREVLSGSIPLQDAAAPIQHVLSDCGLSAPADTDNAQAYSLADFERDFKQLTPAQQQQVLGRLQKMIAELK